MNIATWQDNEEAVERYRRYRTIVDQLRQRSDFALTDIHEACQGEKQAFVTRVVNELIDCGWILRESRGDSDEAAAMQLRWNTGRGEFPVDEWLTQTVSGTQIKSAPEQERPRERLIEEGVERLSLADLLAILIRSGRPGESALAGGEKLARAYQHRLLDLAGATRTELKEISKAIEKTAFCQIMAGIELGRRMAAISQRPPKERITSPALAMQYCQKQFQRLASTGRQEEFHIVTLNTKNEIIDTHCITVGTLDSSLVHPREVFRPAIRDAAASVILLHNHPSGDPTPSSEDFAVTRRLESAGDLLGIKILDHIVLGLGTAVSIREAR